MRPTTPDKMAEIDANLGPFEAMLPVLQAEHPGQSVLMRAGQIVDFFSTPLDAQLAGLDRFSDGLFSVQEIQSEPERLGYFTYALSSR